MPAYNELLYYYNIVLVLLLITNSDPVNFYTLPQAEGGKILIIASLARNP